MIELKGKRALVTGAGKRVGAAIARELGAQGMRVAVHFNASQEGAEATAAAIREAGGEATLVKGDLTSRERARGVMDRAIEALGGLDLFVASAANFERVPVDQVDDEAWDRSMRLNLEAPFAMALRAREALREARGSMVFITCASTATPYRNYLPYVVSKAGLRQMMRALALELAGLACGLAGMLLADVEDDTLPAGAAVGKARGERPGAQPAGAVGQVQRAVEEA